MGKTGGGYPRTFAHEPIYIVSGVELKSLVANDDVVNIKLPMNQIYIVKAGLVRYKVAL